jgi:hypothetical protein
MTPDARAQMVQVLIQKRETTIAHLISDYRANKLTDEAARGKIGELSVIAALLEDLRLQAQAEQKQIAQAYRGINGHS